MKFMLYILTMGVFVGGEAAMLLAQPPTFPPAERRTVVADVLDVDGDFIIVRGDMGEIRIEVKPETRMSEAFQFGDRIKAVIRPNDAAISVDRAGPDDPIGVTEEQQPAATASASDAAQSMPSSTGKQETESDAEPAQRPRAVSERLIVADLLMVDGDFYVVRGAAGEIRIEVTPDTELTEGLGFGDRIQARVKANDRAVFIKRAGKDDVVSVTDVMVKGPSVSAPGTVSLSPGGAEQAPQTSPEHTQSGAGASAAADVRTIVAEVLMVDGDFIVVRGERGEIRIEVTPETRMTETFQFGDRIKAVVRPNDRADSVVRAGKDEPIGVTP